MLYQIFLLSLILPCSFAYLYATGLEDFQVKIWNDDFLVNVQNFSGRVLSLDIVQESKLIIVGTSSGRVAIWNLTSNLTRFDTSWIATSVWSVLVINNTHFLASYKDFVIFWSIPDLNSTKRVDNTSFGEIKCMKLLSNIVLTVNDAKNSRRNMAVFSLISETVIQTIDIGFSATTFDAFNSSFILSPCSEGANSIGICKYSLNTDYNFNKTLFIKSENNYNSLRIVNESISIFGYGSTDFGVIDLIKKTSNKTHSGLVKNIQTIEILNDTILTGHINGTVSKWDIGNFNLIKTFEATSNDSKVNVIKKIEFDFPGSNITKPLNINSTSSINIFSSATANILTSANDISETTLNPSKIFSSTDIIFTKKYDFTTENNIIITSTSRDSNLSAMIQSTSKKNESITSINFLHSFLTTKKDELIISTSTSSQTQTLSTTTTFETIHSTFPISTFIFSSTTQTNGQMFSLDLQEKNITQIIDILKSNIDANDCLTNCSGHGNCLLINGIKLICEFFKNYTGPACQINTLACSSNPCLNRAKCIDNLVDKTYSCECFSELNKTKSLYYGNNCELKIDVCENEKCSNNGVCYDSKDEAKCKCFKYYSGEKCEIMSNEMKITKTVITTASIIAIIFLCFTFFVMVINDISNIFCKKNVKNTNLKKKKAKKPTKLAYKN